jgi:eukaryotic-like serine/threonine-protein kinase
LREAQATAAIRHENVVIVHSVESDQGLMFLVMEYVPGVTLQERIDAGPLTETEIQQIGMQIAQGYWRRRMPKDSFIKPTNILLLKTDDGRPFVKISDFALARMLCDPGTCLSGVVAGTPDYMSPEQARGEHVDHRTDLFSLGSVLYTMCAGRPPFHADGALATISKVCDGKAARLATVSPSLNAVISLLLMKNAAKRPTSASEVSAMLGGQQPAIMPAVSLPRMRRWRFVMAAGLLLALVAGGWLYGGMVYRVATNQGQLIIETADADVEVRTKGPEVKVIDARTRREITLKAGQYELELVSGPQGIRLRTTEFTLERGGKEIVRVRLEPGVTSKESRILKHDGIVHALAFSGDGRRLLSGGWDHSVRLWDAETGHQLHAFNLRETGKNHAAYSVAISRDGRRGLAGSRGGRAWLFDLEQKKPLGAIDFRTPERTYGVNGVAFSPDDRQAFLGSFDGDIRVCDAADLKELRSFQHAEQGVWGVDVSRDGSQALTIGGLNGRGVIRLWHAKKGELIRRFEERPQGFWRAVFSADGRFILTAGGDKMMRLWDTATGSEIRAYRHPDQVRDVSFSADGRLARSGCSDNIIRLWDLQTGRELHQFRGHSSEVNSVAFSPDGRHIASASADKTVRLWRLP